MLFDLFTVTNWSISFHYVIDYYCALPLCYFDVHTAVPSLLSVQHLVHLGVKLVSSGWFELVEFMNLLNNCCFLYA